jgi:uncharacterized protein YbjT (DUF2867 family)
MSILVIGGTGTVGSQTTKALLARGEKVSVLTRSKDKFATLPAGATGVVGDMEKPETLAGAMRGIERLFLLTPLAQNETEQGLAAVEAAKQAGVKRIVYMSVFLPEDSTHIPHFKSKIPVEDAVRRSGAEWTLLRPNNFFQNDFWFQQAILEFGVYPQPIGSLGVARVDVRDIADAAVNALTQAGHHAQVYPLNGPESLTGEDVARLWSKHLGRQVRYGGDDLEAWAQQARTMLPDWLVHDFVIMYTYFQEKGFRATDADLALQRQVVGHDPRRFEDFVQEVTPAWKGRAAGNA